MGRVQRQRLGDAPEKEELDPAAMPFMVRLQPEAALIASNHSGPVGELAVTPEIQANKLERIVPIRQVGGLHHR
jgi:hypothetical protein